MLCFSVLRLCACSCVVSTEITLMLFFFVCICSSVYLSSSFRAICCDISSALIGFVQTFSMYVQIYIKYTCVHQFLFCQCVYISWRYEYVYQICAYDVIYRYMLCICDIYEDISIYILETNKYLDTCRYICVEGYTCERIYPRVFFVSAHISMSLCECALVHCCAYVHARTSIHTHTR